MLLPENEALLFIETYGKLQTYAAVQGGGVGGIVDHASWREAPPEARAEARDYLLDHVELIRSYVSENPDELPEVLLDQIGEWRHFVRGNFFVERDLAKYTVFLDDKTPPTAYAVLGLTIEIVEMLPLAPPMLVIAVLLPWRDVIICDGLFASRNIVLGGGIKRMLRDTYRAAKAAGIVRSLPPSAAPPALAKTRKPKSPPIVRLLRRKDLPKTVDEFRQRFGEPRMEMANEAAREYGTWTIDGTPALDVDQLLIYANVIKDQVLYVYAKDGQITHVSVVDPTSWRPRDLRPAAGVRLVR